MNTNTNIVSPLRGQFAEAVEYGVVLHATRERVDVALPSLLHIPSKSEHSFSPHNMNISEKRSRRMGVIFDPDVVAQRLDAETAFRLPSARSRRPSGLPSIDGPPPYRLSSAPPPYSPRP